MELKTKLLQQFSSVSFEAGVASGYALVNSELMLVTSRNTDPARDDNRSLSQVKARFVSQETNCG